MRTQITSVLAVAVLSPFALAAPAAAASDRQRYDVNECFSEEDVDVCVRSRGILTIRETPSGNFHVLDNSTVTFRVASPEGSATGTSRFRYGLLLKNGREQVEHARFRLRSTVDGMTCDLNFRVTRVKGRTIKELDSGSCGDAAFG